MWSDSGFSQVRELCKGLPPEFGTLLCYTRNLKFDESPNYNYCRKLLREVFEQNCFILDYVYDWTVKQVQIRCFRRLLFRSLLWSRLLGKVYIIGDRR